MCKNRMVTVLIVLAGTVGAMAACRAYGQQSGSLATVAHAAQGDHSFRGEIEADWLRQAEAYYAGGAPLPPPPMDDWRRQMAAYRKAAKKDQFGIQPAAPVPAPTRFPTAEIIARARRLADDLRGAGVDVRPYEAELEAVQAKQAALAVDAPTEMRKQLYFKARWAVRKLALSNPAMNFRDLLLVKRFTQQTLPVVELNHMPWVSRPGGDLCVVTLGGVKGEPQVRPLLCGALGPGHIHGMDLWWDASRVVFGYARSKSTEPVPGFPDRLGHETRLNCEPTHIFEIGIDGKNLRRLTYDHFWSDLDPTYLPDGQVAFASDRCGYSTECNDLGQDETSCNLYIMRGDGSHVRRLVATKDGDYLPHCLDNGLIAYTHWEYEQREWAHIQSLWTVHPDGTGADALFKQHMNNPWALEDPRSVPGSGGSKLVAVAAGHHTLNVGPVVLITPSQGGLNDPRAIRIVTPGVRPAEGGMSGAAVAEGGVVDGSGFYATPWPLSDKYFLTSYSPEPTQLAPAGYRVYLIDVFGNKELLYRDPAISCFTPIPLRPRSKPPVLPDTTDPVQSYAVCSVSQAAFGAPGIEPRQARYLRITQGVPWPYDERYGGHRYEPSSLVGSEHWNPVRVLGTVPLMADGSACFKVPADEAVYFQLLDENQMELRRMRAYVSFQRGERRGCVGCHETHAVAPSAGAYPLATFHGPVDPVPPPWGTGPMSFLRDVQPIFDKHCVACHAGLKPAGGLDFSGGLTSRMAPRGVRTRNVAYDTIHDHKLIARASIYDDARITPPLAFGSHRSKLVEVLQSGACSKWTNLSAKEWLHLITWIDLNGPYHDRFINTRAEHPPYDLPADKELLKALSAVHARRCQSCHAEAAVSRLSWIDLRHPEQSLFLAAPLARTAGGSQKCSKTVYADAGDADYQAVLKLVRTAVARAWQFPRRDLEALMPATARALGQK